MGWCFTEQNREHDHDGLTNEEGRDEGEKVVEAGTNIKGHANKGFVRRD